jgi:hypothetical protein
LILPTVPMFNPLKIVAYERFFPLPDGRSNEVANLRFLS